MEQPEQAPQYSKKDLNFLQEMADKYGPTSRQYNEFLRVVEQDRIARDLGIGKIQEKEKPLLSLVKEILRQIDSIQLFKANKKEQKILEQQKQEAKDNIKRLLKSALEYVKSIDRVQQTQINRDKMDLNAYQQSLLEADKRRRLAHNALFDQAARTALYINLHFGRLSPARLEKFEEDEENAGRPVLNIDRQKFPPNLLWPEKVNLNIRESVGDWALLISRELADMAIEKL